MERLLEDQDVQQAPGRIAIATGTVKRQKNQPERFRRRLTFANNCNQLRVRPQILLILIAPWFGFLPVPVSAESAAAKIPAQGKADNAGERHSSSLYVTGAIGMNWPTARVGTGDAGSFTEFSNPGFSTEIGLGYTFKPLRAELTYALDASRLRGYNSVTSQYYSYNQGGETRKNSAFASLYWDLFPGKRLTPYIGGGLGLTSLEVGKFSEPGYKYDGYSKALFGYQAKAGISYAMDPKSKIFAEAIYRGTSAYTTNDGFNDWRDSSFSSWGGQIGVRVGF